MTDKNISFSGESGIHEATLPKKNADPTDLVMRSPSKKQGASIPNRHNRKCKLLKVSPKNADEKDTPRRSYLKDRSPNRSQSTGALRRSKLNNHSSESARSTSPAKHRGKSCSLMNLTDDQYDSSPNREKKQKNDRPKGKRSVSKSPPKSKAEWKSFSKNSKENEAARRSSTKSPVKRGRPPKQNVSRDSIAKTIERVIERCHLSFSPNGNKITDTPLTSPKKRYDKTSASYVCKRPRSSISSDSKFAEDSPKKKKRGRPKGSKNKKSLEMSSNEKGAKVKKSGSHHTSAVKYVSETSDTEDLPPFKKVKLKTEDEPKYKTKSKPKKSLTKKIKLRNSSLKKGVRLSKAKTAVQPKLAKKMPPGSQRRKVGRPRITQNKKMEAKPERKNQKQKDHLPPAADAAEMVKHKTSKVKSHSQSRESDKSSVKEKVMLPIKKKYSREYISESDNTSGKEDEGVHVPVIKNPKKAFRDKWKREQKQMSKAEKSPETDKKLQRREQKQRAVTFHLGKGHYFTDSEDEADKDTDSEREPILPKYVQKKKAAKKNAPSEVPPPKRRTARMASLNALAMMHCIAEDAKVSFGSSSSKNELAVVPRKESTIARRHSDSDSDDSDSDSGHRDKPTRGRPRKNARDTSSDKPPKKRKIRRNELGVTMDIREMVVKKRMASLNASAIMAASFSMESRSRRIPTSNSSENEATDVDIKHKISYKATKEDNIKTRSVITVQETTKRVKKAQGRRQTEVEESIVFKKKVKRRTGIEVTDTDKEDIATDASENDSELLPKSPESGMMIESTITYVTTQTLTAPKSAPGINKYCHTSPNNTTSMVQHLTEKSRSSTTSSPHIPSNPPHPSHTGQATVNTNQQSFNPNAKYSPLGALSEMHPVMHPHLQAPHSLPFPPPQHHMLQSPQHHGLPPYHQLSSHAIPPQIGAHHPIASIGPYGPQYPPLSPHSPPYPPPPKSTSTSPGALSPSSTPHRYESPKRASPVPQGIATSSSPKSSISFIAPVSSPHKMAPALPQDERLQSLNKSQSGTTNCERHQSAFTAPTPSALSPVACSHGGYQPVSGPMPTGNTPSSSSYKPPQQGSPLTSFSPSATPAMAPAKPYKHEYYPVGPQPPYHGHSYPYDKYLRGPPYQFYQHHYPAGSQFGTPPDYNYSATPPAPPSGSMHCSQEYAYTLCIPGPPPPPAPQSHHQPLALPPPTSSSAPPNSRPQYCHYPEYAPVFAYPPQGTIVRINVLGPTGQNAACYPPPKNAPPGHIGIGKGPDGNNREAWGPSGAPYNYQYYNAPNSQVVTHYAPYHHQQQQQHASSNEMNHCDKHAAQRKSSAESHKERKCDSSELAEREQDPIQHSMANAETVPKSSPHESSNRPPDNAKQNGVKPTKCKQDKKDFKVDISDKCLPSSVGDSSDSRGSSEKYFKPSTVASLPPEKEGDVQDNRRIADSSTKSSVSEQPPCSDVQNNSKIKHIVPLHSASISPDAVPTSRSSVTPTLSQSVEDSSTRKQLSNAVNQTTNYCDPSFTSTTSTISLSSSESHCSSIKSSANPLVTSSKVSKCQDVNDFSSTNGNPPMPNIELPSDPFPPDKSAADIKIPKKSPPDQRSGMRHLLCQSQPLSHSKSASGLVKAKPSNLLARVAKTTTNKSDSSLDKSNNLSSSGPKNFYARSSEISTDSLKEKTSVETKEGRNLTQPRKRGRPPKAKSCHVVNETVSETSLPSSPLSLNPTQDHKDNSASAQRRKPQLICSLDQNLNTVSIKSKDNPNKFLKMESLESVKLENIPSKDGGQVAKGGSMESLSEGYKKLFDNTSEDELKQNINTLSNQKFLEGINMVKHEDKAATADTSHGDPETVEVVDEFNRAHQLMNHPSRHQKPGRAGRPPKHALNTMRRKNVSLLSYLKDKNSESDTSIETDSRVGNKDDNDQSESPMKCAFVPFPPTSPQLPRKRRSSGLMKNKFTKKPKYCHGWYWQGEPSDGKVWLRNDENLFPRKCYQSIKHKLGDSLKVRDCVLLRSGTRRTDLPYVAKIAALWEDPDTGDMMMSILWYYRPEHTEYGRKPEDLDDEIFASKHRDHLSVACIDDRCFVLTYNEYCRYRRLLRLFQMRVNPSASPVPHCDEEYLRLERLPSGCVVQELLFICRKVYDYRQRRILKNPC